MKAFFLFCIGVYRLVIAPLLHSLSGGQSGCRFTPTCSAYAAEAVQRHGAWHGGALTFKRICKCHPWYAAGFDPVPLQESHNHGR